MLDKIQYLSEEEMIQKVLAIFFLLKQFGGILWKNFRAIEIAKAIYLGAKIKPFIEEISKENQEPKKQVESVFKVLDLILDFKKNNPEVLEDIFKVLEDFSLKYKENKEEIEEKYSLLFDKKQDLS